MSLKNPLTLKDWTGENDFNIPSMLEHEDEKRFVFESQKGITEIFDAN